MHVSSNGKVRRNADEWREIIARFGGCGLNRREFCHREKINKTSFDRWYKRLRAKEQGGFVEVAPSGEDSCSSAVEIELPDGTIVRVGN
jgi:hypothetical protein